MESTVKGIWNAITDVLDDIVNAIVLLLTDSPFKDVEIPAEVKQLFGYVNYFVPVTAMLAIGTTWLTAIGVYYLYIRLYSDGRKQSSKRAWGCERASGAPHAHWS